MVMTEGAAMFGAWPIRLDQVFSGLTRSLIFGVVVSQPLHSLLLPAGDLLAHLHRRSLARDCNS
jgi:multidrug efflux pump subunit AcrB